MVTSSKFQIKVTVATDELNSRNETWHWTNQEIGVAVKIWLWVQVEVMAWQVSRLEHMNRIQLLWIQIPLRQMFHSYFKESFSGEYHIYHSFRYTDVITPNNLQTKANVATDESNSWNKTWHWTND